MPKSNEVEESNGSHDDLHTPEIGIRVENKEELNTDKGVEYEGKAAECTETIVLEGEVEEASCDTDIANEIEKEFYNDKGMDSNVNEEVPEIKEAMPNTLVLMNAASSEIEADVSETKFSTEESADFVTLEAKNESIDAVNSLAQMPSDISLSSEEDERKMKLNWNAVIAELTENYDPIAEKNEINLVKTTEGPHEIRIIQHEESTKSADKVISDSKEESTDAAYQNTDDSDITLVTNEDGAKMKLNTINWNAFIADLSDNQDPVAEKNDINLVKDTEELHEVEIVQHEESTEPAHQVPLDMSGCLQAHPVHEQDLRPIAKPTSLTPIKSSASKASVTKKRMPTAVSDDKENIDSGSKLVLARERARTMKKTAENVQSLDHLSVRKLSMMLKEKLTITNKESKNENENEQALVRPALQPLPENR
ncbi:hypothetical protein CDL12_23836 [Handroanthus impetiginosus]|uniref:Uncharacterized protein n=1 Tax=Handroanthus impetiginosus TaxID=429701 RepID=A0A2G9GEB8_9LAMI|nr:hypothetical protein CDL12_23836 [Handroanthus impetiginosus]